MDEIDCAEKQVSICLLPILRDFSAYIAMSCVFCSLPQDRIIDSNDLAVVIRDAYPVSSGHTLVIPKRHVGSFFEISSEERSAMLALLDKAAALLKEELGPSGFNIGINDGSTAGQTVPHLHMHLIPRYPADMPDPRGGVRWVIPEKADYWSKA
ncbi:HIT family protein [Massilia sp. SYSU DXS3249]